MEKATHFILIVIARFPFIHSRLPIGADTPRHSGIHLKPLLHHLYNIGESIFSTPISVCNDLPKLPMSNIDFYLPTLLRITNMYMRQFVWRILASHPYSELIIWEWR